MIEVEIAVFIGILLSLLSGLAGFTYARSVEGKEDRDRGLRASDLRQLIIDSVDDALKSESRATLEDDRTKELLESRPGLQERPRVGG